MKQLTSADEAASSSMRDSEMNKTLRLDRKELGRNPTGYDFASPPPTKFGWPPEEGREFQSIWAKQQQEKRKSEREARRWAMKHSKVPPREPSLPGESMPSKGMIARSRLFKERNSGSSAKEPAEVLMVVIAIPSYPANAEVAKKSHIKYAARNSYRLVLQHGYQGSKRFRNAAMMSVQKLLACQFAQGERFVLVLDYDVVIAPWAPPLHDDAQVLGLGNRVGIVDGNQPNGTLMKAILQLQSGRYQDPNETYRRMGFDVLPARGILDTGVLLVQPEHHKTWLRHLFRKNANKILNHPSPMQHGQALIGSLLVMSNLDGYLPHAWNRKWVWYNRSNAAGLTEFEIGDVFKHSYFMHFSSIQKDMNKLRKWMTYNLLKQNITQMP